jgi:uncharacterized protein (TIGR02145 family)
MKRCIIVLSLVFFSLSLIAQAPPQGINYQAVVYSDNINEFPGVDISNLILTNSTIKVRFTILSGSSSGTEEYIESHITETDEFGLFSLIIGMGDAENGYEFSTVNWGNGDHYLKVEIDKEGGNNYLIMSNQQLMSVPYALYSKYSEICGNGLIGVIQNTDGTLTFTYADSTTYTTDTLNGLSGSQGPPGPAGPEGTFMNGNNPGDMYYWDGSNWIIIPIGQEGQQLTVCNGIPHWGPCNSGVFCSSPNVFNTNLTYGSVSDTSGNSYKTIQIGSQKWMAENLRTSKYQNGDPIPNNTNVDQWIGLTSGVWCHYQNNSQYECPYGKLYNWYVVSDSRNVCPTGWHVPTNSDWQTLILSLDPNADITSPVANSTTAGSSLKSTGLTYWSSPNSDATNVSGFSALPNGRLVGNTFNILTFVGYWWSSTPVNSTDAYNINMYSGSGNILPDQNENYNGLGIRCIKD